MSPGLGGALPAAAARGWGRRKPEGRGRGTTPAPPRRTLLEPEPAGGSCCRLDHLPIYGCGISSGGSFVLKLPRYMKVHGVCVCGL